MKKLTALLFLLASIASLYPASLQYQSDCLYPYSENIESKFGNNIISGRYITVMSNGNNVFVEGSINCEIHNVNNRKFTNFINKKFTGKSFLIWDWVEVEDIEPIADEVLFKEEIMYLDKKDKPINNFSIDK